MYKLINTGKAYEIYRYDQDKYSMIGKVKSTDTLTELVETFAPNIIQSELFQALKYMVQDNHNTAEFGYNGTFTVSYYK
jgi:hypothetical protein